MIRRSEMLPRLVDACPSFTEKWEEHKREYFDEEDHLPYIALGKFADHLIGLYNSGKTEELPAAFAEIEHLHLEGEHYVREAATIGVLEGLQNIIGNRGLNAEILVPFLGPESAKWWDQFNKFWDGEIRYVGETVDREVG